MQEFVLWIEANDSVSYLIITCEFCSVSSIKRSVTLMFISSVWMSNRTRCNKPQFSPPNCHNDWESCSRDKLLDSCWEEIRTWCLFRSDYICQVPQCCAVAICIYCWPVVHELNNHFALCISECHQQWVLHIPWKCLAHPVVIPNFAPSSCHFCGWLKQHTYLPTFLHTHTRTRAHAHSHILQIQHLSTDSSTWKGSKSKHHTSMSDITNITDMIQE